MEPRIDYRRLGELIPQTRDALIAITKAVVSPAAVASGHQGIGPLRRGTFLRVINWTSTSAVFVMRCRCSGDIPEHRHASGGVRPGRSDDIPAHWPRPSARRQTKGGEPTRIKFPLGSTRANSRIP